MMLDWQEFDTKNQKTKWDTWKVKNNSKTAPAIKYASLALFAATALIEVTKLGVFSL